MSYKFMTILFIILLSTSCKLASSIEGSGGFYTEDDQSLSK